MQKTILFILISIFFFNNHSALAGFDKDDVYSPPAMPKCSITSLQLIANNGDCLIFEGKVWFGAGYSSGEVVAGTSFYLQSTAISQTDIGTIATVIKLKSESIIYGGIWPEIVYSPSFAEAYMAFNINDNSFIKAGLIPKSIASLGHDKAYNFLGLRHDNFRLAGVKEGPYFFTSSLYPIPNTDYAIQLFSDLGNGIDAAIALEDLAGNGALIGVLNYSSENLAGHFTILADEILTGNISTIGIHTGAELTFNNYKFLIATSFDSLNSLKAVASAQAIFDKFTLAASVATNIEYYSCWGGYPCSPRSITGLEYGLSASAAITDDLTIKFGGQWDDHNISTKNDEIWNIDAGIEVKLSETITLTTNIGILGDVAIDVATSYGSTEIKWKPNDEISSSIKALGNANGAFRLTFITSKSFK